MSIAPSLKIRTLLSALKNYSVVVQISMLLRTAWGFCLGVHVPNKVGFYIVELSILFFPFEARGRKCTDMWYGRHG